MGDGAVGTHWYEIRDRGVQVQGEVIEETLISIYVNGRELATFMSTPRDQEALALGFLKNEGFIEGLDSVDHIYLSANKCCVDVYSRSQRPPPGAIIRPRRFGHTDPGAADRDGADRLPAP